jgi:hypothetical protein
LGGVRNDVNTGLERRVCVLSVWSRARPAKGDCKLRGFEQEGKAVFQGKMKRKKKEHEAARTEDETENDAPDDEVEGGGRACTQKGC